MIVISPYSNKDHTGKLSPKNWGEGNWEQLVQRIKKDFHYQHIVQIGIEGEQKIKGVDLFLTNQKFEKLKGFVETTKLWISVDNFFPHFCKSLDKNGGVVIFGPSNSRFFGYKENYNLHGNKKYLRKDQFLMWSMCEPINNKAFPTVSEVYTTVKKLL
jgi:hypothetical protein